jgi:hypothetical protein
MKEICPKSWDVRCDSYLNRAPPDNARELAKLRVEEYLNSVDGGINAKTALAQNTLRLCSEYPGICDDILDQKCAGVKRTDLLKNKETILAQVCGCHMAKTEYSKYSAMNVPGSWKCDPACVTPGVIKRATSDGKGLEMCANTNCIVNDALLNDLSGGSSGKVDIKQICDTCTGEARCVCHLGSRDAARINNRLAGGVTLEQKCNVCLVDNPDDSANPFITDCTETVVPDGPDGPDGPDKPDDPDGKVTIPTWVWGVGGVSLLAVITIVVVLIVIRLKRRR